MNYSEMIQTLRNVGRAEVIEQIDTFVSRYGLEHKQVAANLRADIAARVTARLYSHQKSWIPIEPLTSAAVLESAGHLVAMSWAVATEIRAGQVARAHEAMIAAGHLICPACGNQGKDCNASSPPFAFLETMDSQRSCGVLLHRDGGLLVSDDIQDHYEDSYNDRVCCQACGWDFELPPGIGFDHCAPSDEIDAEIDAHTSEVKTRRVRTVKRARSAR